MIMLYFVMRQRPTGVTRTYTRLPYTTLFRSLYVLTLGGDNEIGRNLNLYGYGDQWLMVDLGTSFADEGMPGVDMVVPDVTWIAGRRKKLLGDQPVERYSGAVLEQQGVDAVGQSQPHQQGFASAVGGRQRAFLHQPMTQDRKSTRLNSSH